MTGDNWSSGYATQIGYTDHAFSELAPTLLDWVVESQGVLPPRQDGAFTYLELGCGHAASLIGLAALHPEGRFYGTDFLPSHIASARDTARRADLDNLTLFDDSFAELLERDLPPFDYITLHGVYSWVLPEIRRHVRQIIRRMLKPGGLVMVSYNCMAGAAQFGPLRDVMRLGVEARSGPFGQRVRDTVMALSQLKSVELPFFSGNPCAATRIDELLKFSPEYITHEFLNSAWTAFSHAEIVEDMSEAKLSFVGSAKLANNFVSCSVLPRWQPTITNASDPVMRETLKDLVMNQSFRSDVFVRGPVAIPHEIQAKRRWAQRVAAIVPRKDWYRDVVVGSHVLKIDPSFLGPVLEALEPGAASLEEIARAPAMTLSPAQLWDCICFLIAIGHVLPARSDAAVEACRAKVDRINRAIFERSWHRLATDQQLVSPVTGTFLNRHVYEHNFLLAEELDASDAPRRLFDWAKAQGSQLMLNGEIGITLEQLAAHHGDFRRDIRPLLATLGLAPESPTKA